MSEFSTNVTPLPDNNPLEKLYEVASDRAGSDFTESERLLLSQLSSIDCRRLEAFRQNAGLISDLLRKIPVQRISNLLVTGPELAAVNSSGPKVVLGPSHHSTRTDSRQKFASVVSLLVLAGCLIVAVLSPPTDYGNLPRITASWKVQKAAEVAAADFPSDESWNVVVVRTNEDDRYRAMKRVQSVMRDHGFEFARSTGEEMPTWLGIVLATSEAKGQALIQDIEESVPGGSIERDPQRFAESSRAELIAAVRESLRYPTQSELHHGKVYLAMPDLEEFGTDGALIAAMERSRAEEAMSEELGLETSRRSLTADANRREQETSEEPAPARVVQPEVVLVVFQFDFPEPATRF